MLRYRARMGRELCVTYNKIGNSNTNNNSSNNSTIREKWNIFIASDSPATKVPGARASRYRVYGVIGLHIGNYPKLSE